MCQTVIKISDWPNTTNQGGKWQIDWGEKALSYKILWLNPCLYYIKWFEIPKPNSKIMKNYFFELNAILDSEEKLVYFLSDLRKGHITNVHLLLQLAKVLSHKNYGGGAAFSDNSSASSDMSMFRYIQNMSHSANPKHSHELFLTAEEAIAYIESLEAGITQNIDWDEILSDAIFSQWATKVLRIQMMWRYL